jgi:isoleucyl-tRNA synthetase
MSDSATKNYTDTLNLPKTEFPMKGNLAALEPKMLAFWQENKVFAHVLKQNENQPAFVLHDGPPYANGNLHAGHALNKILKDMVVKFQNLNGKRADFIPGWDCHGLPIEQAVEKSLREKKIDKRLMSKEEFLTHCRAYAEKYVEIQAGEFKRMGVLASYENPYKTLDTSYEAQEIKELATFARKGSLYRKKRPVFWCVYDQTALALAEVEYEDIKVPSVYVAFRSTSDLSATYATLKGKNVDYVIWTTTPWTLPANLAICLNATVEYVFYELGTRVVVVAKDLLLAFLAHVAPGEFKEGTVKAGGAVFNTASLVDATRVLAFAEGKDLEGQQYAHAFLPRTSPIVLGEHVTTESGTGLVHTAPGHGPDDYEVGLKYGLDIYNPVKGDGRYDDTVSPEFTNMFVYDANEKIPALLHQNGVLLNAPDEKIVTSYPHSWRSKKPVVFRATPQWFISMEANDLRQRALHHIDNNVKWVPAWGRDRIHGMLSTRPDWTISRQRTWGVPIPTALCTECNHSVCDADMMLKVAIFVEKEGVAAWYTHELSEFYPGGNTCPNCKKETLKKESDILDVWFDSACSFAAVVEQRENSPVPVDLYLEGSDQHRGWFHSSLLVGTGTRDMAPYKTCLTHGFVVDGNGNKMSKSMGNTVSPDEIIKKYGAEIMRLWVASSDYRDDVRLSWGILDTLSEGYRKVRNTIRYGLSNLYDFNPATDAVSFEKLEPLDAWALSKLRQLALKVKNAYENFEFHAVYHAAMQFCAIELSAQYFDIQKDNLYTSKANGSRRRSAQTVLFHIAKDLTVMLAPITSFTSEEAFAHLPGEKLSSVFMASFPKTESGQSEDSNELDALFQVRTGVLPLLELARKEKQIGKSLEAKVILQASGPLETLLTKWKHFLPELFIVSQVEFSALPDGAKVAEGVVAKVEAANGHKCPRCWSFRPEVNNMNVCHRCIEALS